MSTGRSTKKADKVKESLPVVDVVSVLEAVEDDADGLNPQQAAFVSAYVGGPGTIADATAACVVAGYSEKSSRQIGRELLKNPKIISAIDARLRDAIGVELTVEAVNLMRRIMRNEEASLKLRGEMAARVIEYSGIIQRTQLERGRTTGLDGSKPLIARSRAELEDIVRQGAAILTAAASLPPAGQVIEGDPAPQSAQPPALAAE